MVAGALLASACNSPEFADETRYVGTPPELPTEQELQTGVREINELGLEMFKASATQEERGYALPYHDHQMLTALLAAAQGETYTQIAEALGDPYLDVLRLKALHRGLQQELEGAEFEYGNALMIVWPMMVDAQFVAEMREVLGYDVLELQGFRLNAQKTANDWAAEATNGAFTDVVEQIDKDGAMFATRLLQVSAENFGPNVWSYPETGEDSIFYGRGRVEADLQVFAVKGPIAELTPEILASLDETEGPLLESPTPGSEGFSFSNVLAGGQLGEPPLEAVGLDFLQTGPVNLRRMSVDLLESVGIDRFKTRVAVDLWALDREYDFVVVRHLPTGLVLYLAEL